MSETSYEEALNKYDYHFNGESNEKKQKDTDNCDDNDLWHNASTDKTIDEYCESNNEILLDISRDGDR